MDFKLLQQRIMWRIKMLLSLRPYLGVIEKYLLKKTHQPQSPQIFILGLPRSGTTLVYQYIVHRLHVSYFTNGVGYYYLSPCVITKWQRKQYGEYKSDFQSRYGKVAGQAAPREGGAFWSRFFDSDQYTNFVEVNNKQASTLQASIRCIQNLFDDQPFVNKNVKHMLRLNALSQIFPGAYFVVVERDIKDVALSLLRGRYQNLENPDDWWSVKPENYSQLKRLPLVEQIVNQLLSLQAKMERDFESISLNRIIRVQYEAFCKNPELIINQLKANVGSLRDKNSPEKSFTVSSNKPKTAEELQLIELVNNYVVP